MLDGTHDLTAVFYIWKTLHKSSDHSRLFTGLLNIDNLSEVFTDFMEVIQKTSIYMRAFRGLVKLKIFQKPFNA